ncbi:PREDICTED: cytochrome P450 71B2-like [Camelina sativa]|uniref:Cytochrome P450 71B2-like n=1 Tax=Camelina sativa TaxID=90675 RepID=A0ABM0WUD4_CAMSA|nr:PREDICTED: cytochrome P450 71B2-like [Camelina sativa]
MEIMLYLSWVLLLALVSIVFLKKKNQRLPPGPRGLPIVGILHQFTGIPHRWFHQLSLKHGPVMALPLGFTPAVVISSREAAEEVLKTKDVETCTRPKMFGASKLSYNFKDITFAQYTDTWRENRKVSTVELLNFKKLQTFKSLREEEMDVMVKRISNSALEQSPVAVDINNISMCVVSHILCRSALGQNLHTNKVFDEEKIVQLVMEGSLATGHFGFSDFYPGKLGNFADWLFRREKGVLGRMFKELDDFYQHVIDEHLKSLDGPKGTDPSADIVAGMLHLVDKNGNPGSKSNLDQIKGVLMNLFLGGIDTVAIIMIWAMTELIRHPRAMKKAQEEIRAALGEKREKLTEEDLEKVEYLKLIVKETFRLHPSVPTIPREAMSPITIQGYDIPADTRIYINVWAIGRDPKVWENPEEFNPERFMNSDVHFKGQHYELLPFGSGRRLCPAVGMASNIIEFGLLNMLYFFDWSLPHGVVAENIDMGDIGNISFYKKEPLLLVPVKHH